MEHGPEAGQVCTGRGVGKFPGDAHRPVVRNETGRCFLCEPVTVPEAIDMAEEQSEAEHGPWCPDECGCRVGSKARIPDAVSANVVTFAMDGGLQCRLLIPTDMSVVVNGGTLVLAHRQFITGITAIVPQVESS